MARNSRTHDIYPISLRELEVLRVEDISPNMRRIILGGPDLGVHVRDGFEVPELHSDGFDDDIRMIFPDPTDGRRPYPANLGDGRLDWNEEITRLFRTYTVRSWDEDAGELAVDFARHGAGLAEDWSSNAVVGDRVFIAGPKNCGSLPTHTDWLLLAGDETALPAIGRCLESLPAGVRAIAVIEVPEPADIQELSVSADADIRWVVRADGGDFVREFIDLDWPAGDPYVWVAGEAGRLKAVRRHLGDDREVPKSNVEISGYWRAKDSSDAEQGGQSDLVKLFDMIDIGPAYALRALMSLDLLAHIEDGANSPSALAAAANVDEAVLVRFLRYLETLELVTLEVSNDRISGVGIGALGRTVASLDARMMQYVNGPAAYTSLAMAGITEALRTGGPVPVGATGKMWDSLLDAHPALTDDLSDQESSRAMWIAPALAPMISPADGENYVVVGSAAGVFADELLRRHPGLRVCIAGAAAERQVQEVGAERRGRTSVSAWATGEQLPEAAVSVILDPFAISADGGAAEVLASANSDQVIVVTKILAETGDDDHEYAEDLGRLCLDGTAVPTRRDLVEAAGHAGYVVDSVQPAGWGAVAAFLQG